LNSSIHGATVHDSKIAREVIILVRDTELPLFHHSRRVYCFSVLAGKRCGLSFDPELSTRAAMFHDTGSPISTAARASVSKSMAPTWPAPFCAALASPLRYQNHLDRLFDNTVRAFGGAAVQIQERQIANCAKADFQYGAGVAAALVHLAAGKPLTPTGRSHKV
jgi:hypothetical protein